MAINLVYKIKYLGKCFLKWSETKINLWVKCNIRFAKTLKSNSILICQRKREKENDSWFVRCRLSHFQWQKKIDWWTWLSYGLHLAWVPNSKLSSVEATPHAGCFMCRQFPLQAIQTVFVAGIFSLLLTIEGDNSMLLT